MKLEYQITNNQSKRRSTPVENVRQITPFYAKQSQFCAFFARKRRFHQKTKPIQTQLKPIQSQFNPKQTQFKPIQTQFKPNFTVRQGRSAWPYPAYVIKRLTGSRPRTCEGYSLCSDWLVAPIREISSRAKNLRQCQHFSLAGDIQRHPGVGLAYVLTSGTTIFLSDKMSEKSELFGMNG